MIQRLLTTAGRAREVLTKAWLTRFDQHRRALRVAVACAAIVTATASHATTYVMLPDEALVDQADLIVRAVRSDSPALVTDMHTHHAFRVNETLKGLAPVADIMVSVVGSAGDPRGRGWIVAGAPTFSAGDEVVLFLRQAPDGSYRLTQFLLGAFYQSQDADGVRVLERRLAGASRLSRSGALPLPGIDARRQADQFARWIALRAAGRPAPRDYLLPDASGEKKPKARRSMLFPTFSESLDAYRRTQASGRYNLFAQRPRWQNFDAGNPVFWEAHYFGQSDMFGGGFVEFEQALASWSSVPGSNITLSFSGLTDSLEARPEGGLILFDDPFGDIGAEFSCLVGGTLAIGGPQWVIAPYIFEGQSYYPISSARIVTARGAGCFFSQNGGANGAEVFAHELGHTLGFDHSCGDFNTGDCDTVEKDQAIMRALAHGDGRGAYLGIDDIAAAAAFYPSVTDTLAGDGSAGLEYHSLTVIRSGTGSGHVRQLASGAGSASATARSLAIERPIVGGVPAASGAWPWQAAIESRWAPGSQYEFLCGGSVIAERWVLTAAHCLEVGTSAQDLRVRVGTNYLEAGGQVSSVERIAAHADFVPATFDNDIALLELTDPVGVVPVSVVSALQVDQLAAAGTIGTVTGWGALSEGGTPSPYLQQVDVPFWFMSGCRAAYGVASITANMFCAGLEEGGRDSCQGDSGGPLVYQTADGGYLQAGIVSWGGGCAQPMNPGVYTNVAEYAQWIEAITGLSVSAAAPAIDCGEVCSASYPSGTTVTLQAVSAQGSAFTGWRGACSGSGQCVVALDEAKAVEARFDLAEPAFDRSSSAWKVAEIYVATMGYAPDNEGLQYWVDALAVSAAWTPLTVAQSFFDQPLVQQRYPDSFSFGVLIDALYLNMFARSPDTAGYKYWLDELQSGRIARNQMIIALIEGGWANADATEDMLRFGNKVSVALAFADYQSANGITYSALSSADQALLRQAGAEVLESVGADGASVAAAIASLPDYFALLGL